MTKLLHDSLENQTPHSNEHVLRCSFLYNVLYSIFYILTLSSICTCILLKFKCNNIRCIRILLKFKCIQHILFFTLYNSEILNTGGREIKLMCLRKLHTSQLLFVVATYSTRPFARHLHEVRVYFTFPLCSPDMALPIVIGIDTV